jgi:uncharacterized protein (UPF0254 family)
MYPSVVSKLILDGTFSYNKITLRDKIEAVIALFLLRLLGIKRFMHLTKHSPEPGFKNEPALKEEMQKMFADSDTKAATVVLKEAFTFDSRS